MIVLTPESTGPAESWTTSCDQCSQVLDPAESIDGPWSTQTAALSAAERRGWWHGDDWRGRALDLCADCLDVPFAGGAA